MKRDATQTWRIWSIVSIQTHNTPASGIGSGSHELPVDSYLILRLESLVGLQEIHAFPVLEHTIVADTVSTAIPWLDAHEWAFFLGGDHSPTSGDVKATVR